MKHRGDQTRPTSRLSSTEFVIAMSFLVSFAGAAALIVLYWTGGQVQLEGLFLSLALAGMATGVGVWASRLMPVGERREHRHPLASTAAERAALERDFDRGEQIVSRRSALVKLLGLAGVGLGAIVLLPIRSLGPRPDRRLRQTGWRSGMRVVDEDGKQVTLDTVPVGGILTVFPESGDEPASSQTVLIRLRDGELAPRPGREDWSPNGYVAYSKLCTHAACPVGLYDATTHELLCPCHQSLFDVLDGARPVFGPATRSLPQLPLAVDGRGRLVAQSDFTEPVGPGFWDR